MQAETSKARRWRIL